MKRQGCFYGADGKITCDIKGDPVSIILTDTNTMFPDSVAVKGLKQQHGAPTPPRNTAASSTVEGFEDVRGIRMYGSPAFIN